MISGLDLKLIRKIDEILHEPSRLSIVLALRGGELKSFGELKGLLGLTDGNLSIHLRTLEERGYVFAHRARGGSRTKKFCRLSNAGRVAFERYLSFLEQVLRTARS